MWGVRRSAARYLRTRSYVDISRIVVMGGSYGSIQTLFGAEADVGYTAAVDCSGAAQVWKDSTPMQVRLKQAVANIGIPVFLLQAQNDFDLSPTQILGALFQDLNRPAMTRIYPPFGSGAIGQEGHNMCFTGAEVWSADAINFIAASQP
jgi:pimeloyl-ACP methyl ester carboxylesterase